MGWEIVKWVKTTGWKITEGHEVPNSKLSMGMSVIFPWILLPRKYSKEIPKCGEMMNNDENLCRPFLRT